MIQDIDKLRTILEGKKEADPIFACLFKNKREAEVRIYEFGKLMCILPPGREFLVESFDPATSYAQFAEITYLENDKVEYRRNPSWKIPSDWKKEGRFLLELMNSDGAPVEGFYPTPTGQVISLPKGIPRIIPIEISSPYIRFCRIEWRRVKTHRTDPGNPRYAVWETSVKEIREERPKAEIEKIEDLIKKRAAERGEKEAAAFIKRAGLEKV